MTVTPSEKTTYTTGQPLLLTPEAAAQALGISRSAIYRLMKIDAIASLQIGRSRRISSESLRSFIQRGTEANSNG